MFGEMFWVFVWSIVASVTLELLAASNAYPDSEYISVYYETAKYLTGMLRLSKGDDVFVRFLNDIVSAGASPEESLASYYEYASPRQMIEDFEEFAGTRKQAFTYQLR